MYPHSPLLPETIRERFLISAAQSPPPTSIILSRAQIFTRNDGIIIDTFLVVDENGNSVITSELQKIFKDNIRKVVSEEVTVENLIQTHMNRWKRRRKKVIYSHPRVRIHNDISSEYTVIDVFATDFTGLLHDIADVLASYDIDIHTAKIGTDEDQIADAFYVQKSSGGKIDDDKILGEIKEKLIKTLDKAYMTSQKGS